MHEEIIASEEEIVAYNSLPKEQRKLNDRLKAVIGEIALTAVIRYPWTVLRPLLFDILESTILDYAADVDVGHQQPLPESSNVTQLLARVHSMLQEFDQQPPFTIQRLCELALAPRKQYTRLDKLAVAVWKLLMVTITQEISTTPLAPPPRVQDITNSRINELPIIVDVGAGERGMMDAEYGCAGPSTSAAHHYASHHTHAGNGSIVNDLHMDEDDGMVVPPARDKLSIAVEQLVEQVVASDTGQRQQRRDAMLEG